MPRAAIEGGEDVFHFVSGYAPLAFATLYSTSVPRQKDERILVTFSIRKKLNIQSVKG